MTRWRAVIDSSLLDLSQRKVSKFPAEPAVVTGFTKGDMGFSVHPLEL